MQWDWGFGLGLSIAWTCVVLLKLACRIANLLGGRHTWQHPKLAHHAPQHLDQQMPHFMQQLLGLVWP